MPEFISDLWIFSKSGVSLIEIFNNDELDSNLLGAFLSAIESFSKQITGKHLSSFNFGDSKFMLASCLDGNAFLVIKCDVKVKQKVIERMFKIIIEYFEELYTIEDIENYYGNSTLFDKFKERIDLYFEMYDL